MYKVEAINSNTYAGRNSFILLLVTDLFALAQIFQMRSYKGFLERAPPDILLLNRLLISSYIAVTISRSLYHNGLFSLAQPKYRTLLPLIHNSIYNGLFDNSSFQTYSNHQGVSRPFVRYVKIHEAHS